MADATAYLASPDDLSVLLGVPATDSKLLLALRRASDRFRGSVGHQVNLVTGDSVTLDGSGHPALHLPAIPVDNVRVKIDGSDTLNFQVSRDNGILFRPDGWPEGYGNIAVTYDHGWDVIPGDIQDAVLEQAEGQYRIITGVQQTSLGSRSVTFGTSIAAGVTQRWSEAVGRYRLLADTGAA